MNTNTNRQSSKLLVSIFLFLTIGIAWATIVNFNWLNLVQQVVQEAGVWGYAIFVVTYAIATLLILPVTALNIAGGALYGGWQGLVLTSVGALVSAILSFYLARSLMSRWFDRSDYSVINNHPLDIGKNLVQGGIGYAFAVRLLPLVPYGMVSIAAGISPIKRRDYLLGTLIGTPLGIAPFVFLGSTGVQVHSRQDLIPLLASSMGLAILIMFGTWYGSRQKIGVEQ